MVLTRFVGLVAEVLVMERVVLGSHALELLFGRAQLEAGVDAVRGQERLVRSNLPRFKGLTSMSVSKSVLRA